MLLARFQFAVLFSYDRVVRFYVEEQEGGDIAVNHEEITSTKNIFGLGYELKWSGHTRKVHYAHYAMESKLNEISFRPRTLHRQHGRS